MSVTTSSDGFEVRGPCRSCASRDAELVRLRAQRDSYLGSVKSAHGALSDAADVPVPAALTDDLRGPIMALVEERNRLRARVVGLEEGLKGVIVLAIDEHLDRLPESKVCDAILALLAAREEPMSRFEVGAVMREMAEAPSEPAAKCSTCGGSGSVPRGGIDAFGCKPCPDCACKPGAGEA